MANEEQLGLLKQGVDVWNVWRMTHPEVRPDLSGASLIGMSLVGAFLDDATLSYADLSKANLQSAFLERADLFHVHGQGVNFFGAFLRGAYLRGVSFQETCLSRSHLQGADLMGANLIGVDLVGAHLDKANLCGADLSKADLRDTILREADLIRTNLHQANLARADVRRANFYSANLRQANLRAADLREADLRKADLFGANLRGANLQEGHLVDTNLTQADLTDCRVYGIAAWNISVQDATQKNLRITPPDESIITVDSLEVAQFIYLLLHNEKIRQVIDTITSKVVLILGRFTPERKAILDAIRGELRKQDYLPVLFDFDKPLNRTFIETVSTLAHMARFVIADVTDPKIVLQEVPHIVNNIAVPVQPLLLEGFSEEPVTLYDLRVNHRSLLDTYHYKGLDDLLTSLAEKVIAPAEAKAKELRGK